MSEHESLQELIDRHLRGELNESEKERLAARLDSDSSARRELVTQAEWDTSFVEVLRESSREDPGKAVRPLRASGRRKMPTSRALSGALLAMTGLVAVLLAVNLFVQPPDSERRIATVTGLNGSLQWIGDGGRIFSNLRIGTELAGGTVAGLGPDSWFELEFNDGSSVTISGRSTLTLSDDGQKVLHLKEGTLACNVRPQPVGKPMLIHTRSAVLEVLGTQFEVEAEAWSTTLNVSQGKVLVARLSDGASVEVPANHRVIAAADRELAPVRLPDSVSRWESRLHRGPDDTYGEWLPATDGAPARLRAVPFTTLEGRTIYTAAMGVSCGENPPVLLRPESRIQVRGHLSAPHDLFVGLTVRRPNGEFAGRFQTTLPAENFQRGAEFQVMLRINDFELDPSLNELRSKLPSAPFDLVVESIWCHTLYEPVGLEVTQVDLIASGEDDPP